jgi:O-antigen ligase
MILLIPIFLILSGFRLLWGLLFLSLVILFWVLFRANKRYLRYGIFAVVVIALALLSLRYYGGGYYDIMKRKLINYEKRSEMWRYDAWNSALRKFYGSPLIGVGLGEESRFWTLNSAGKWFQTTHPTHNIVIDLLYQTGMVGALFFMIIVLKYGLSVYKSLRKVGDDDKPVMVALFVFFVCALIQSFFQPYLNHPGNAVSFFACMGIGAKLVSLNRDSGSDK